MLTFPGRVQDDHRAVIVQALHVAEYLLGRAAEIRGDKEGNRDMDERDSRSHAMSTQLSLNTRVGWSKVEGVGESTSPGELRVADVIHLGVLDRSHHRVLADFLPAYSNRVSRDE